MMPASGDDAKEDAPLIGASGLLFAWDGRRHLAFRANQGEPGALLALFAHTSAAQELTAVWEAGAGTGIVALPEGCRHLELHLLRGGLPSEIVAVELDDLLLPDLVAAGLPGLRRVSCAADGDLAAAPEGAAPPGAALCVNMVRSGVESFSRIRVGPLFDPADGGRRIGVEADATANGIRLSMAASGQAQPLVAHVIAAARDGSRAAAMGRFEDAPDALGARPAVFLQRGFRMLAPVRGPDGGETLELTPFEAGDEAIVFAPRGWLVGWSGRHPQEPGERPTGSRLFLSRDEGGDWRVRAVATAYRPASSTAMAALGGGALTIYAGGATATASAADMAADLAAAIWRRARRSAETTPASLLAEAAAHARPDLPPLARLTRLGANCSSGLSPVVAALGRAHGVAEPAIEEIDALPAPDRLALVLWFAEDPAIAAKAVAARILLPPPAGAPPAARIAAVLAWWMEPRLRERIERAAVRIVGAGRDEDRRILRQAADAVGESWFGFAGAASAEMLLRQWPDAAEEASDAPARGLIAKLRVDAAALAAAQAESRGLDLAQIAEWRSELVDWAAKAALPQGVIDDLGRRLAELEAADIVLLRRHFHAAADRRRAVAAVRDAVDALDAAAGNGGLARRIDRSGDPLVGMTRLGSTSEAAVRALTRIPAARAALVALTAFVDRHVAAGSADALLADLRRNLQSYGCLMLSQAIARECAAALPTAGRFDADGAPAWRERLRSGIVETLPAYVSMAAETMPEDAALGASLTDGLAAAS